MRVKYQVVVLNVVQYNIQIISFYANSLNSCVTYTLFILIILNITLYYKKILIIISKIMIYNHRFDAYDTLFTSRPFKFRGSFVYRTCDPARVSHTSLSNVCTRDCLENRVIREDDHLRIFFFSLVSLLSCVRNLFLFLSSRLYFFAYMTLPALNVRRDPQTMNPPTNRPNA